MRYEIALLEVDDEGKRHLRATTQDLAVVQAVARHLVTKIEAGAFESEPTVPTGPLPGLRLARRPEDRDQDDA